MKHLNIEQAEAVKVIIDFDLCKFYAYLDAISRAPMASMR